MGNGSFRAPVANLAALGLAVGLLGAAPPPGGTIYVTTLPSAAAVWLDGTYVGRSPVVVSALSGGAHHLTLSRTGWEPADLAIRVGAEQTATASVVLNPQPNRSAVAKGTLVVHAAGPISSLEIDGVAATPGRDGAVVVSAGPHELVVVDAQGKATRNVTVFPETRTEVVVRADGGPRALVVAPADDYLPADAYRLEGTRLVVRFAGHVVVAHLGELTYEVDGRAATYDTPPQQIRQRLYLPLELLTLLTSTEKK